MHGLDRTSANVQPQCELYIVCVCVFACACARVANSTPAALIWLFRKGIYTALDAVLYVTTNTNTQAHMHVVTALPLARATLISLRPCSVPLFKGAAAAADVFQERPSAKKRAGRKVSLCGVIVYVVGTKSRHIRNACLSVSI